MSQAAYYNGYDDGYDAARKEFGGPGPGGGGAPTYMANAESRYVDLSDGNYRMRYAAPESVTAEASGYNVDILVPDAPAGSVMDVNLGFEDNYGDSLPATAAGIYTYTVNGESIPVAEDDAALMYGFIHLVLWFDGTAWTAVSFELSMP